MIPEPPPTGSPARRDSRVVLELLCWSKPEIMEEVGEERPRRLGKELALKEEDGYRDV